MADYAGLLAALADKGLDTTDVVDFTGVHATESPLEDYQYRLYLVETLTIWVDIKEAVFPPDLADVDASSGQVTIWTLRDAKLQYGQLTLADAAAASFLTQMVSWDDAISDEFMTPEVMSRPSGRGTCREFGRPQPPSGRGGCIVSGRGGCMRSW